MKRPNSPPPPPEPDHPRVVIDQAGRYSGVQVIDAREHIRIKVSGLEPAGFRAGLRAGGFKPAGTRTWQRPHTPAAIVEAQAIVSTFFGKETP